MVFWTWILGTQAMSTFKPGTCYQFSCGNDKYINNVEQPCMIVNHTSKSVTVNKCDDSIELMCPQFPEYDFPENEWNTAYCANISTQYPSCDDIAKIETGEQCCNNDNCISGSCLDGKCIGKPIGSSCEKSNECESNSFCEAIECTKTRLAGDACDKDEQCSSGFGCNKGNCTQIFSLSTGSEADDEKFCMSNFMAYGICEVLTPKIRGVEGDLFSPYLCLQGQVCDLYYSNGTHYGDYECLCAGYHDLVEGFCGYDLLKVGGIMDRVYKELQYTTSVCTGDKAHSNNPLILLQCESITRDQFNLFINIYQQHKYYNIYVTGSLDSCAQDFNLWDYTYSFKDYLNLSATLSLALSLLLVVV